MNNLHLLALDLCKSRSHLHYLLPSQSLQLLPHVPVSKFGGGDPPVQV